MINSLKYLQAKMGIRFTHALHSECLDSMILSTSSSGDALILGNETNRRILGLYQITDSEILFQEFKASQEIKYSQKYIKVDNFGSDLIIYGSNEQGFIIKIILNEQDQITAQELQSESYIKEIQLHPTQDQLVVMNDEGVKFFQMNYTLPFSMTNNTIKDTFLASEQIQNFNYFYLALITEKYQQDFYLQLHKAKEQIFGQTYHLEESLQISLGWGLRKGFQIISVHYYSTNQFYAVRLLQYQPPQNANNLETKEITIFFNSQLQEMTAPKLIRNAQYLHISQQENKMIFSQGSKKCSYVFDVKDKSIYLKTQTENCFYQSSIIEYEPITIDGYQYPVFRYQIKNMEYVYAAHWDFSSQLAYITGQNRNFGYDISTAKPDHLIERTSSDFYQNHPIINVYGIAPITGWGIFGLTVAGIVVAIILGCLGYCLVTCIQKWIEERKWKEQMDKKRSELQEKNQRISDQKAI